MRGGSARRVAALLVFALAGLAVAGTSPPPTRSPTILTQGEGTLELSADQPMRSVVVTVVANAALLSEPTNQTRVSVARMSTPDDGFDRPIAVMAIEAIDASGDPIVGSSPSWSESMNTVCQFTGDCTRRYRITAVLAGPAEAPVKVGWRVVAETRTGTDAKPGTPPPGAMLSVESDEPVEIADRSAGASVGAAEIRLDPAHARFVRTVTLVQPGPSDTRRLGVLRSLITRDQADSYRNPGLIRLETLDGEPLDHAGSNANDVTLPVCAELDGCRTQLRVVGTWLGGPPDEGASAAWTFGASIFDLDPTSTDRVGGLALELGDLVEAEPIRVGTSSGSLVIGGEKTRTAEIKASFDAGGIVGSTDGAGVFLQATMTATTTSRTGSTKNVVFRVGQPATSGVVGTDLTVVSELIPLTCVNGTRSAVIPIRAWVYGTPVDDVTLDWKLDAVLVADPGISLDLPIDARFPITLGPDR